MKARSAGALALARTGKTQAQVAVEVGVSGVTAHHWSTGEKKPGPANRTRLRELYGIAEDSWDVQPVRASKPRVISAPTGGDAVAAGGVFAMAREVEQMIQQQMAEARQELAKPRAEREGTPLELAKLTTSLVPALSHLAKLTGQYDLGRRMLQLPIWRRIEAEIGSALKEHPEAAAAVAERFRALEASERSAG